MAQWSIRLSFLLPALAPPIMCAGFKDGARHPEDTTSCTSHHTPPCLVFCGSQSELEFEHRRPNSNSVYESLARVRVLLDFGPAALCSYASPSLLYPPTSSTCLVSSQHTSLPTRHFEHLQLLPRPTSTLVSPCPTSQRKPHIPPPLLLPPHTPSPESIQIVSYDLWILVYAFELASLGFLSYLPPVAALPVRHGGLFPCHHARASRRCDTIG